MPENPTIAHTNSANISHLNRFKKSGTMFSVFLRDNILRNQTGGQMGNLRKKEKDRSSRESVEMPKQAKGVERLEEEEWKEFHKVVPATEANPTPAATGARLRSAPTSIVGTWIDLAAHHAISHSNSRFLVLCSSTSGIFTILSCLFIFLFFYFFIFFIFLWKKKSSMNTNTFKN